MGEFEACFARIGDWRFGRISYALPHILFISFAAVLSGAEGFVDMARFAQERAGLLRERLGMVGAMPSHDVFREIYARLDPKKFDACFASFTAQFAGPLKGLVAVDGKSSRGSAGDSETPLHLVNAWSAETRLVLGQLAVGAKTNEITAVPLLLDMLSLEGCTVVADALNTQRATAEKVLERGADYILPLKGNQKTLLADVALALDDPKFDTVSATEVDSGHGRIETRVATVCADVSFLDAHRWPGLKAIGKTVRTIETKSVKHTTPEGFLYYSIPKTTVTTAYHLMSHVYTPVEYLRSVRSYWGVEAMHWSVDVVMGEDRCQVRERNAVSNLSALRKWLHNLVRADTSRPKETVRGRFKIASWNPDYMLSLLANMGT